MENSTNFFLNPSLRCKNLFKNSDIIWKISRDFVKSIFLNSFYLFSFNFDTFSSDNFFSLDYELTLFYPCHNTRRRTTTRTPHQNLAEGCMLQVCNLAQRLNLYTTDHGTTVTVTFVHTTIVQVTNETRMAKTF